LAQVPARTDRCSGARARAPASRPPEWGAAGRGLRASVMKFVLLVTAAARLLRRGEPVTKSHAFDPPAQGAAAGQTPGAQDAVVPKVRGPCANDPCTGAACCCWSTFAQEEHITYPNPEIQERKRQCLNPPSGFILVKQPGYVGSDGFYEALQYQLLPEYPDRSLCCTVSEKDVITVASRETMAENIDEEATPPPPTAWPGPPIEEVLEMSPAPPLAKTAELNGTEPNATMPPIHEMLPNLSVALPNASMAFPPIWNMPVSNATDPLQMDWSENHTHTVKTDCALMPGVCSSDCMEFAYCAMYPDEHCASAPTICSVCEQYAHCPLPNSLPWDSPAVPAAEAEGNYPAEPLLPASPSHGANETLPHFDAPLPDLPPASPNGTALVGKKRRSIEAAVRAVIQPDMAEFSRREHASDVFAYRDLARLQAEAGAAGPRAVRRASAR